jgi:hypothetical protein
LDAGTGRVEENWRRRCWQRRGGVVVDLAEEANSMAICDDDVNGATARGKDMVGLKICSIVERLKMAERRTSEDGRLK